MNHITHVVWSVVSGSLSTLYFVDVHQLLTESHTGRMDSAEQEGILWSTVALFAKKDESKETEKNMV